MSLGISSFTINGIRFKVDWIDLKSREWTDSDSWSAKIDVRVVRAALKDGRMR